MSAVKNEFAAALAQVASEHNISVEDVLASIELAVLAAYHKEVPGSSEDTSIVAKIDKNTGETFIFKDGKNITPPGFGRIAAQTAKQVIIQKIRETEKKIVLEQFKEFVGTVVRGRVIRIDPYGTYVDIGKTEGILPREEQVRNERLTLAETYSFLLKEIAPDKYGNNRIVLSRSSVEFLEKLFAREVPEIASGSVVIKKAVREPGVRAKVAVASSQSGVDPVGACVGQKGIRVQTITEELGGSEKIDILQWTDDEKAMLKAALAPAKIDSIELNEKKKTAKVYLPEDQAPLAIGAGGVNVNLASKLTGYSIDIVQSASKEAPQASQNKEKEEPASDKTAELTENASQEA